MTIQQILDDDYLGPIATGRGYDWLWWTVVVLSCAILCVNFVIG